VSRLCVTVERAAAECTKFIITYVAYCDKNSLDCINKSWLPRQRPSSDRTVPTRLQPQTQLLAILSLENTPGGNKTVLSVPLLGQSFTRQDKKCHLRSLSQGGRFPPLGSFMSIFILPYMAAQ